MWKKFTAVSLMICMSLNLPTTTICVSADSLSIENAITWAIGIANDESHGYSMQNRFGPDYDCSSFVISALKAAGFDTGSAYNTQSMKSQLTQHGFVWIPWNQIVTPNNLQRGDILLTEMQHTEFYIGNNQNVGAHLDYGNPQEGDQNGKEISVVAFYYQPWDGVLRYNGTIENETTTVVSDVDQCDCSDTYEGEYFVSTDDSPLLMRSGHGTNFAKVTSIPKGSIVYVTKGNGSWAHVQWNSYSGYSSMLYLTPVNKNGNNQFAEVQTEVSKEQSTTKAAVQKETTTAKSGIGKYKASISKIKNKAKGRVRITIGKNIKADGFQIKYALNKKITKKRKDKNVTSYAADITALKSKKTYYFKVRAFKVNKSKTVYSKWSDVKKKKVK